MDHQNEEWTSNFLSQVSETKSTFGTAESECLISWPDWPHAGQIFFTTKRQAIETGMSISCWLKFASFNHKRKIGRTQINRKTKCLIIHISTMKKTQPLAAQSCNPFTLVGCNMADQAA